MNKQLVICVVILLLFCIIGISSWSYAKGPEESVKEPTQSAAATQPPSEPRPEPTIPQSPTYPIFEPPADFLTHEFWEFTYTEFETYEELRAEQLRVWQYLMWLSEETRDLIMSLDFLEDDDLWEFAFQATNKQDELLDLYNKYTADISKWLEAEEE